MKRMPAAQAVENDMTPMIDMTFQLIAFFMVIINFNETDANQAVELPSSKLAKPPQEALEAPIVLQLTGTGSVLFAGDEMQVEQLGPALAREQALLKAKNKLAAATVIIRADINAPTGRVQELIKKCQDLGFDKFALRAIYDKPD